jgi:CheY-like chemotaxis protein
MPQTIMIAAHDPNITYLLQRYAEESGFQTVSACQGKDVLDLAHHARPALIILDIELPGTTGEKLLRGLKSQAMTCNIPVVLYPGLDDAADGPTDDWMESVAGSAGVAGVAGYLPKSVMYDDFLAVLEHAGVHN